MPAALVQPLLDRRRRIAWLVLLSLLILTLLVWYRLHSQNEANAAEQFRLRSGEVVNAIEQRLHQHEQILLGGAGLFNASDKVSRLEWHTYIQSLRLSENYPGILGVGYSEVIAPADLQHHIASVRAEGFPSYTVTPPGKRQLYTAIIYLEPFTGRNLAAFGYDMFSQETRRKAMQAAVDSGETTISGKVTLVQETHGKVQAGFLMYVPVYRHGAMLTTAAQRWHALRGFVYSPYRVDDLMKGILGERNNAIDFVIHDEGAVDSATLMYDSVDEHPSTRNPDPHFTKVVTLDAYHHRWTISLGSNPAFDTQYKHHGEWMVLLLGVGVSLSLFLFTWVLVRRREEALKLANAMTVQLRADEERLAELNERFELAADSAGIGVWEYHPASQRLVWNEQMYRLYQVEPSEFTGVYQDWSSRLHPDDLTRATDQLSAAINNKRPFDTTFRILQRGGEVRYLKADARVICNEQGEVERIIGVNYDITALRQAEEAIRHSRKLLSDVLQAASAFSIIATDPDGTITIFNRGAELMLGYKAEEMVGKQTPLLIHLPAEIETRAAELSLEYGYPLDGFRVFVEPAERFGVEQRQWTYVRKDGHPIPVSLVVSVMHGESGEVLGYLGIAEDITRRLQAEEMLREQREKLSEAQRIAKVGSWTLELRTNHLEWSDEIFRIFEIDPQEFGASYEAFLQAIHPDDRAMVDQLYRDSLVTRQSYQIDHRLMMNDGRIKYVQERCETLFNERGEALLSRGTVQDITQLKLAEMEREEQARHTQTIIDNVFDGIITINEHGTITSFNKAAELIFGYMANEVVGYNVATLMPEPHRSKHDVYLSNYLMTGVARIIGVGREVTAQRKDGSTFPMELAVSEIQHHGHPLFIGMARDITERKRIDELKSEFVSTVSHELRTPLTSISGALGLLVGGAVGSLPEQAVPLLDIAQKNSLRLTHLINDLLDMEKIAAGKLRFDMQVQPLMPLLEQVVIAMQGYGEQYQVRFDITQRLDEAEVRVDSQRLMQVLSNYLSNSAKFSPRDSVVELAVIRLDGLVRVTVRDHGPGIPVEFRSRIFQKFSQADSSDSRQKGGTGLGLAITKELVERMGGKVGFESEAGNGATFFFDLPIVRPSGTSPGLNSTLAPSLDAPHLLVVEDDADIAQLLALMLQRGGYHVDVVSDGGAALSALARQRYAAMTLDLSLPDIGGLEIIRQVRNQPGWGELPIIVISARVEEGRLAIDADFSAIDWLAKPVDERRLMSTLEKLLPKALEERPRVLHVEDDVELHQTIAEMAVSRFDFELATTLAQARSLLTQETFDMVLLDLSLPDGSGWELLPILRALHPEPGVIILSGSELTAEESARVEATLHKSKVSPRELLRVLSARIAAAQR